MKALNRMITDVVLQNFPAETLAVQLIDLAARRSVLQTDFRQTRSPSQARSRMSRKAFATRSSSAAITSEDTWATWRPRA